MNAHCKFPLLALLAFVLAAFVMVPEAQAHAFPTGSQPAVGATVEVAPGMVKIWFNSNLEPLFDTLVVKNAAGEMVSEGNARVDAKDRTLLEVELRPLTAGTYHVYWRVTSKDGHVTEGDYTFTVSGQ